MSTRTVVSGVFVGVFSSVFLGALEFPELRSSASSQESLQSSFEDELHEEEESLDGCGKVGNKVVGLIEVCGSAELKAKTF